MSSNLNNSENLIDNFIDELWLEKGLSKNTLSAYRHDISSFSSWYQGSSLLEVQNKTTKVVKNTTSRYTPDLGLEKGRDELTFLAPAASCLLRQRDHLRVFIYGRHMSPASTKRFVPFRYNT
jgi:integrase/recombinase XerD